MDCGGRMCSEHVDYYDVNLGLLNKMHPHVWKQITDNPPDPVGTIFFTKNGKPNITVVNEQNEEVILHNEIDPEKETKDLLGRIPEDHKGFVAILGMGLGYAVINILKERPQLQKLAVFELEPGIFVQALKNIDLSPLLNDKRLILHIGSENDIKTTLSIASLTLQLETANIFHQLPSFKFDPSGYEQLKNDLFTLLNSLNVDGTTTRLLGKDFFNNRFEHITTIHHQFLLEQIQNKFSNIPAIMVAGGPSLDKNIDLLVQAQDKAVIIAVDTVLPTLLKHGIYPHFLTCIDPNNLTYEKFADVALKAEDISLVCSSWVNPKTPKFFPAFQTFWTFTSKPVEAWLNSLLGGKIFTGGASTVAHLNLIAAHALGCNPIVFVGQDLAYSSESATHAKNTVLHGKTPTGIITGNTEGQTVKGIDGKMLRTNRSFLSMKKHFEANIVNSDRTFINATKSGAHIEGTTVMDLQEVINRYCNVQVNAFEFIKEQCASISPIESREMINAFDKMLSKIKLLKNNMKKADDICEAVLKKTVKMQKTKVILKSFAMLPEKQKKQINKIDILHKNLDNALEVWRNLEEITLSGLKKSERQKQDISILENDPANYPQWLINNIRRLLDINKTRKETIEIFSDNLVRAISFQQEEKRYFKEKNFLELIRLYMRTKNYNLAKPIVKNLYHEMPESAEINFYCGCLAAQFSEYTKAEDFFKRSIAYDRDFSMRIDNFRQDLGDEFLGFALYFKAGLIDLQASVKYMLRKGLQLCQTHKQLIEELEISFLQDLKQIDSYLNTDNFQDAAPMIEEWYQNIIDQEFLTHSLSKETLTKILINKGRLQLADNDDIDALLTFKKAMTYSSLDEDLYILTVETLFKVGDFNGAIDVIKQAIKLDKKFAVYWETIGESLQTVGQNEEAIIAYEQCYIHLPDKIDLIKKIGDCYMATDQLEAAKVAYEQFKLKMENNSL